MENTLCCTYLKTIDLLHDPLVDLLLGSEVNVDNLRPDLVLLGNLGRHVLELVRCPTDQDNVQASLGQFTGVYFTYVHQTC